MKNLVLISFLLVLITLSCGKDKKSTGNNELKEEIQRIESETQAVEDIDIEIKKSTEYLDNLLNEL